ncbi:hypothetical protein BDQ12DRAFT_736772 [Crucibulum laeve]|uniref:DUF7918 domain-containing protein n=1 Tax=Crucibulum laeve TaxID=68775 RepID=A0A5C3LX37_9AGAR|nr:hypothetical protein BDQ12DRAFT_736772 [Crucibulum laeve]
MLKLGTLSACIKMDGKELTEYGVDCSADGKQATCWIPSEVGKQFSVYWKDSERVVGKSSKIVVDGIACNGGHLHRTCDRPKQDSREIKGVATSSSKEKPFKFAMQELTDEEEFLNMNVSAGLAQITLVIHDAKMGGIKPYKRSKQPKFPTPRKIHERAKKGVQHAVELGDEIARHPANFLRDIHTICVVGTFTFRYRPLSLLRASGIAPPEKPTGLRQCAFERERKVAPSEVLDLTGDDPVEEVVASARIRALREELYALENQENRKRKRVKDEETDVEKKRKAEVKRERLIASDTILDLTSSD